VDDYFLHSIHIYMHTYIHTHASTLCAYIHTLANPKLQEKGSNLWGVGQGVRGTKCPWSWRHFLIFRDWFLLNIITNFIKFRLHCERGSTSAPAYNGQGVRGTKPPETDDIFLFQRLISFKNYHVSLGNLDYMTCLGARLRQHKIIKESEELRTFSYIKD